MPALLRYHSVVALAESSPYRSPVAFELAQTTLSRAEVLDGRGSTAALAQSFEAEARVLAHGHSLATITGIRDNAWFPDGTRSLSLAEHLQCLARRYLCWRGSSVCLRFPNGAEDPRRGLAWREMSLQLPQDLLIAGLVASEDQRDFGCDHVRLIGDGLDRVLAGDVAETHLHVGAALDFPDVWLSLLLELTEPKIDSNRFDPAPQPFMSGEDYLRTMSAAVLVRHLLFAFLWAREVRSLPREDFGAFIVAELGEIATRCGTASRAALVHRACDDALASLHTGLGRATGCRGIELRHAHRLLWGPRGRGHKRGRSSVCESDPLTAWLDQGPGRARPELRFMTRAMLYLKEQSNDGGFARSFWQYIRVRNLCFGHLVERPGTGGLDWFTRHYERLWSHRGLLSQYTTERALDLESRDLKLSALEVRTAPPERWVDVRQEVRAIAKQCQLHEPRVGAPRPEIALVLHFIKTGQFRRSDGQQLHAEPRGSFIRHRYGHWFAANLKRARALERALEVDPKLLLILRGLDVAAHELALPNWPLVPIFARVRRASSRAARQLARERPSWAVPPLRTTLHAGEEFRRPSEGLRRIHEALEFGLLYRGDRIGHGLVLGWPIDRWCERNAVVVQPREDRLADLLWEVELYNRAQLPTTATRIAFVRAQAQELGEKIFAKASIGIDRLVACRRQLFDPNWLIRDVDYPYGRTPRRTDGDDDLALKLLSDGEVYERASALVEVQVDDFERGFLRDAQAWLVRQLANLGVTIESNPSSNLVIGDFDSLAEHPTFRLAPWARDGVVPTAKLPVSINTDDPLTFASKLADEYAYMDFALRSNDVSVAESLRWLSAARDAGWNSRFSLPASREPELLQELLGRRTRGWNG